MSLRAYLHGLITVLFIDDYFAVFALKKQIIYSEVRRLG